MSTTMLCNLLSRTHLSSHTISTSQCIIPTAQFSTALTINQSIIKPSSFQSHNNNNNVITQQYRTLKTSRQKTRLGHNPLRVRGRGRLLLYSNIVHKSISTCYIYIEICYSHRICMYVYYGML